MKYSALDVARYVVNYVNSNKGSISNLKLQKILYYIQAAFLVENGTGCFNDAIMCWRHGPVIKNVYDEFNQYGDHNIPFQGRRDKLTIQNGKLVIVEENFSDSIICEDDKKEINKVINGLMQYDPWYLVDRTHEEDPWKYLSCYNVEITPNRIKHYFNNHKERIYGKFN